MTEVSIRPADARDEPFLWRMLAFAASMTEADVDAVKVDPDLRSYVEGFGRPGDLGVVATGPEARPIGAAWLRLAPDGPIATSKVWTRSIPEIAIAVEAGQRGSGVGAALLEALLTAAAPIYPVVALSVREENTAVRLYERLGFVFERRVTNRVGKVSLAMRLVF